VTPETILDTLDTAVYSEDRQGRYTYANRMVQEIFGAPLRQIVGHDDSEFIDLQVSNDLKVNDEAVMTSGQAIAR